jgi:cytochrome c-type biogenesis protein CcmH
MTNFFIPAFLLLALVLLLLLHPFLFPRKVVATSRRQMNAAIYREELDKLEAERTAGLITSADYEISHAEMRQRLFQDTNEEDDHATLGSTRKTTVALLLFVVILSSGLYFVLGDVSRVAQLKTDNPMT